MRGVIRPQSEDLIYYVTEPSARVAVAIRNRGTKAIEVIAKDVGKKGEAAHLEPNSTVIMSAGSIRVRNPHKEAIEIAIDTLGGGTA
ncbi:MAG TPA: hypothetical protein PKE00_02420 [Planctomycetota bacterium]|nr:hypothetical protein [Planctomycetota bacterium]